MLLCVSEKCSKFHNLGFQDKGISVHFLEAKPVHKRRDLSAREKSRYNLDYKGILTLCNATLEDISFVKMTLSLLIHRSIFRNSCVYLAKKVSELETMVQVTSRYYSRLNIPEDIRTQSLKNVNVQNCLGHF